MRLFALPCPVPVVLMTLAIAGCYVGPGEGSGVDAATDPSSESGVTDSTGITGITGITGSSGSSGGVTASSSSTGSSASTSSASSTASDPSASGPSTSAGSTGVDSSSGASEATTDGTSEATTDIGTTGVDPTTGSTSSTSTGGDSSTSEGGGDPNDVCGRWTMDRQDLGEGAWSGDTASCQAGDVSAPGRANALKLINLYRWLADLPAVADDPIRNDKAQRCALMMQANGQLSHSPPMSWKCYSAEGAEAAGKSNIAGTAGVAAVDLYMADPGNMTTMGHRRWILSNGLGPVGLGTASSFSCMWVIGGNGGGTNEYTAWPSPGDFPLQAMTASWKSVDETGWTIQSNAIDLKGAQVTITRDGQAMPVTVTQLLANYGSASAISMIPQGWSSEAGATYTVTVNGVNPPITYDVHFVDCS